MLGDIDYLVICNAIFSLSLSQWLSLEGVDLAAGSVHSYKVISTWFDVIR